MEGSRWGASPGRATAGPPAAAETTAPGPLQVHRASPLESQKGRQRGTDRSDAHRKKHSKYTELFSLREEHRESLVTAWVNVVLQKVLNYSEKNHKKPRRRGGLGQAERRREEGASSERSSLKSGGAL